MPGDTKLSGSAGEHYVCSMLARTGWAASLTRDGLARTDILAVKTDDDNDRRMIEVQVKTVRVGSWSLGQKSPMTSMSDREWYVLVLLGEFPAQPRTWVVPRDHVAAATWIAHMSWLTDPAANPGTRNVGVEGARLDGGDFARYEDRWDLLDQPAHDVEILLPQWMRDAIDDPKVGLPPDHAWRDAIPEFAPAPPKPDLRG